MKIKFLTPLIIEILECGKYVRYTHPFEFYCERLGITVTIPAGFVCDFESDPLFKSNSKRAGGGHDYFSRKDSIPVVSKQMAASIYLDMQKHKDNLLGGGALKRFGRFIRRHFKTLIVRVTPCYFHRFKVMDSYRTIRHGGR